MKKALLMGLSLLLLVCSCSSIEGDSSGQSSSNLKVNDLSFVGEFHNALMSNANSNFNIRSNQQLDKESIVDSILLFNTNAVNSMAIDNSEKEEINKGLKKYKNFVVSKKFETLLDGTASTRANAETNADKEINRVESLEKLAQDSVISLDKLPSLKNVIADLYNNGNIDNTSKDIYMTLIDLIEKSCAGLISDEELTNQVNSQIDKFDNSGYTKESPVGVSTGAALSISKASLEWWQSNESAILNDSKIPHVIAMDIGGAIYGAAVNAAYQAAFNRRWNWKSFGWGVASGAVSGSLGMAGRVWKWLRGY